MNLFIACYDKRDNLHIEKVKVVSVKGKNFVLSKKLNSIKPISTMHWDSVYKSVNTKTLPLRCISTNYERGYVFEDKYEALARLQHLTNKLEESTEKQFEMVGKYKTRLISLEKMQ